MGDSDRQLTPVWPENWPRSLYELEKRIDKLEWESAKTNQYAHEVYGWMRDVKAGEAVKMEFSRGQRWFLTFALSVMSLVTATTTAVLLKVLE